MEVILLERVAKLGQMGDVVRVKNGFARNFLLPQGKALRATAANKSKFETMKVDLQARNETAKAGADKIGSKLNGQSFVVLRQASETGQLSCAGLQQELPRRGEGHRSQHQHDRLSPHHRFDPCPRSASIV